MCTRNTENARIYIDLDHMREIKSSVNYEISYYMPHPNF